MPKLFSNMKIIRVKDGVEEIIPARTVFQATVAEAKQFDALGSARPALMGEIEAADQAQALADGMQFQPDPVAEPMPDSGAAGDPRSAPKAK